jgi:hypothetical protein
MKQKNFISMLVTSGNGPAECSHALERGNPLRCFVGAKFKEKGGKGCSI